MSGQRVSLTVAGHAPGGARVVSAHGQVTPASVPALRDALAKLLVDGEPVLLDVADLQMEWMPAPEIFVTAVTAAGGWPLARLVLFGADPGATERLRACRIPDYVPLAGTVDEAVDLVALRPDRLSFGIGLPAETTSVNRAREAVREALDRWRLAARQDVDAVVTALAGNAVEHARTPFRVRVVLDRSGLRVSVRDRRPGPLPDAADVTTHGGGLCTVARLSRTWGVLRYGDGKAVWAQLPSTRATTAPRRVASATRSSVLRPAVDDHAATVDAARHHRFVTADAEHAHAFLRTVYGEHTLRLSGAEEQAGFHLEYDGTLTNRFAVERLGHGAAVEGAFPAAETLVVVDLLAGALRVTSGREQLRVAPDEVVLCAPDVPTVLRSTRLDAQVVRLPNRTVARVTAELTGFDAPTVPFDLSRAVSPARAALWRATVDHLRRDVLADDEVMASPLSRTTVLRTLVAVLLETFPNPARDGVSGAHDRGHGAPRTVRRAVRFIEEHAGQDIGLAEIAAAAGVGARGLQLAFRRHTDATPLEYLRRVRLDRAHRDLQAGDPADATVRSIAGRWGFPHHSSFSTLYLRTYGRSPSATLRS